MIVQGKSGRDVISKLEDLLAKSQTLKHGLARAKRVKAVRSELNKVRRLSKSVAQGTFYLPNSGSVNTGISTTEKTEADSQLESQESEGEVVEPGESQTKNDIDEAEKKSTNLSSEGKTYANYGTNFTVCFYREQAK